MQYQSICETLNLSSDTHNSNSHFTDQSLTLSLALVQLNNILQDALILISNQHPEKPKTGDNLAMFTFKMGKNAGFTLPRISHQF